MTYQVFARKYRPQSFGEVIGQEGIVKTLQNAIALDRIHHAYLFCGARGVGKTSLARIYAKSLNCAEGPTGTPCQKCASCLDITSGNSMDVLEIDGASNTGVDDVRELREQAKYLPSQGKYRIYIIDEVHMLSKGAFNALLKILEEPPAHVIFVFATTEPHKIPITILSRCQRFDCKRLPLESLSRHLKNVLASENVTMPDDAVSLVANAGDGSVRDSLSLMDQVVSFCGNAVTLEQVRDILGLTDKNLVIGALKAVLKADVNEVLERSREIYEKGADLKIFAEEMLQTVHRLLLIAEGAVNAVDASPSEKEELAQLAHDVDASYCLAIFQILSRDIGEMGHSSFPRLVLETSFLKMIRAREYLSIPQILESLSSGQVPQSTKPPAANPPSFKAVPAAAPIYATPVSQTQAVPPPQPASTGNATYMDFIARISATVPQLMGLIDHARPLTFSRERIVLGFEKSDVLQKDMLHDRLDKLSKVAVDFFGAPVKIELQTIEASGEAPLPASANETRTSADKERMDEITRRTLAHPGVQKAKELLGAKISEIKEIKS